MQLIDEEPFFDAAEEDGIILDIRRVIAREIRPIIQTVEQAHGAIFKELARLRHNISLGEDDEDTRRDYLNSIQTIESRLFDSDELEMVPGVIREKPLDGLFRASKFLGDLRRSHEELRSQLADMRRLHVDSPNDPAVREAVKALTEGLCAYCDAELGEDWHIEHVVPKSAGGPDTLANYVPSCKSCNSAKHALHVLEFIRRKQGNEPRTAAPVPVEFRVVAGE